MSARTSNAGTPGQAPDSSAPAIPATLLAATRDAKDKDKTVHSYGTFISQGLQRHMENKLKTLRYQQAHLASHTTTCSPWLGKAAAPASKEQRAVLQLPAGPSSLVPAAGPSSAPAAGQGAPLTLPAIHATPQATGSEAAPAADGGVLFPPPAAAPHQQHDELAAGDATQGQQHRVRLSDASAGSTHADDRPSDGRGSAPNRYQSAPLPLQPALPAATSSADGAAAAGAAVAAPTPPYRGSLSGASVVTSAAATAAAGRRHRSMRASGSGAGGLDTLSLTSGLAASGGLLPWREPPPSPRMVLARLEARFTNPAQGQQPPLRPHSVHGGDGALSLPPSPGALLNALASPASSPGHLLLHASQHTAAAATPALAAAASASALAALAEDTLRRRAMSTPRASRHTTTTGAAAASSDEALPSPGAAAAKRPAQVQPLALPAHDAAAAPHGSPTSARWRQRQQSTGQSVINQTFAGGTLPSRAPPPGTGAVPPLQALTAAAASAPGRMPIATAALAAPQGANSPRPPASAAPNSSRIALVVSGAPQPEDAPTPGQAAPSSQPPHTRAGQASGHSSRVPHAAAGGGGGSSSSHGATLPAGAAAGPSSGAGGGLILDRHGKVVGTASSAARAALVKDAFLEGSKVLHASYAEGPQALDDATAAAIGAKTFGFSRAGGSSKTGSYVYVKRESKMIGTGRLGGPGGGAAAGGGATGPGSGGGG